MLKRKTSSKQGPATAIGSGSTTAPATAATAATIDRRPSSRPRWITVIAIIALVASALSVLWKIRTSLLPVVDYIHHDHDHSPKRKQNKKKHRHYKKNNPRPNEDVSTTTKPNSEIRQDAIIIPEYDDLPDLRNPTIALVDMFGSDLPYIRGSRSWYTPAPEEAWDKFVVNGKAEKTMRRILTEELGLAEVARQTENKTKTPKKMTKKMKGKAVVAKGYGKDLSFQQAWLYYRFQGGGDPRTTKLLPFQRYGRIPRYSGLWESKDLFLSAFRKYATAQFEAHKKRRETVVGIGAGRGGGNGDGAISHPDDILWFLPRTYRLTKDEKDRKAFLDRLAGDDNNNVSGMDYPWVLKQVNVNNGKGIEMLPPNSEALRTAVDRVVADKNTTYVVQQYICNELTWFRGEKFDLRMFWLVVSVDPLIVLFEDGYVRPGTSYDETNWNTTGQHLTNHEFRVDDKRITYRHLHKLIQDHYDQNKAKFRSEEYGNILDPIRHVRNQMKEAIAHLVAATKDGMREKIRSSGHHEENNFSFYGCDFILDADLDVWFIESQASPGIRGDFHYDTAWTRIFPPMIRTVAEIAWKQQHDATANIFPLENLGGWEVVYAQDHGFRYKGYKRSKNKKSCESTKK